MGLKSRTKGAAGERELCRRLTELLGATVVRNLAQTRDGGDDLIGVGPFAVECKRAASPKIGPWWQQAVEQAQATGRLPALAYRLDRRPWRVIVALRDVCPDFTHEPPQLDLTCEMPLEAFAHLVRERLSPKTHRRKAHA